MIEFDETVGQGAKIRVVGVGGGGGNAVNTMIELGLRGVDFIAANTDLQALELNGAHTKIQVGQNITRGLGSGGDPEVGRRAAIEDRERVREVLDGADMVFVTAGMGGGPEPAVLRSLQRSDARPVRSQLAWSRSPSCSKGRCGCGRPTREFSI
jgi:cell division protein FtsZ